MTTGDGRDQEAIDWAELRDRLDAAAQGSAPTGSAQRQEHDRKTLDARAIALSRPIVDVSKSATSDVLVFSRGMERFGIDMSTLLQVHRPRSITPLPGAEHPLLALVGWRGRPLSVIDVGSAAGIPASTPLRSSMRVLVIDHLSGAFGILADEVLEIRSIQEEDMIDTGKLKPDGASALQGLTKDAVTLIDAVTLSQRIGAPRQKEIVK